jgi:hypothetical protein
MKDCRRWRNDDCSEEACPKWARCTLMNPNALPAGTKAEDYDGRDF